METKEKKLNISVSVHKELLKMVERYCKDNKKKKSKFIEDLLREFFKK